MVGYPDKTLEQQTIEQLIKGYYRPSSLVSFLLNKGGQYCSSRKTSQDWFAPTGIKEYTHKVKKRT